MKIKILLIYALFVGSITACSVQDKDQQKQQTGSLGMEALIYEHATATDTVLRTDPMVERRFVRLPDTPQGYRAQALLDVILQQDEEQILPFVYEHYDPDFIAQVPQSDHKQLLRQLQQQAREAQIESFEKLDGAYRIGISNATSAGGYLLDVYFAPDAPHKISGVRVL